MSSFAKSFEGLAWEVLGLQVEGVAPYVGREGYSCLLGER